LKRRILRAGVVGLLGAAVAGAVTGGSASAALIPVYEPFNYDPASVTKLDDQMPDADHIWYHAGAAQPTGIARPAAGNLSVPDGLPAASGNHAVYGGAGETARLQLVDFVGGVGQGVTSGKVYYSLALTVTDTGTITGQPGAIGQMLMGFNNTPTDGGSAPTALGACVWVQPGTNADSYRLGFSSDANTADRTFETGDHPLGSTVFLVGELELVDGAKNDVSNLWINPGSLGNDEADLPAPTIPLTNTSAGGADLSNVSTFILYRPANGAVTNVTGVDGIQVDELRVGGTYAAVTPVPEPATAAAAGALLLLGSASLRRGPRRRHG
jgi:hypothetical protein